MAASTKLYADISSAKSIQGIYNFKKKLKKKFQAFMPHQLPWALC